jgi:hypothetical protein
MRFLCSTYLFAPPHFNQKNRGDDGRVSRVYIKAQLFIHCPFSSNTQTHWSAKSTNSNKFAINMSFKQFLHIVFQNWIRHWISHIWKPTKAHFIQISTLLSQKDMYINTFHPGGGDHLGFLNSEALSANFELGIQQIWVQHPSIPLKKLYALN